MTTITGEVAAGLEPVREAFAANFARHEDIGAAVWTRETLQLVYSATTGATATAAHLLAQRGALDLDAPVAEYWPEFAANGKVNHILDGAPDDVRATSLVDAVRRSLATAP